MKKQIISFTILLCALFLSLRANAQQPDTTQILRELQNQCARLQQQQQALSQKITRLSDEQAAQQAQWSTLQAENATCQHQIDTLQSALTRTGQAQTAAHAATQKQLAQFRTEQCRLQGQIDSLLLLSRQLTETQSADRSAWTRQLRETNATVQASNDLLSTRTLWGIAIGAALLALIVVSAFLLQRKIRRGSSSIAEIRKAQDALQAAQTKIQEESLSLDNKLLELAEKQINAAMQATPATGKETDHSLALKVADEVTRIEMNLSRMDPAIRGHKQLAKAVERIKSNFLANGYEMVDMLGKPYHEGMKVIANFVSDENLKEGEQIITGIIKPQINYNGKMIQAAQITVSQNI